MQAQQLLEFLGNHPLMTAALVGIAGALAWTFISGRMQSGNSVTPLEAIRLVSHEDAVVVDVRGDGEYDAGHIVESMCIAESAIKDSPGELQKYKSRPVIVVCKTGQRSAGVSASLRQQGFEKAVTLNGGIAAWQSAGLPLTRKK